MCIYMCITYGSITHNSYFSLFWWHFSAFINTNAMTVIHKVWYMLQLKSIHKIRIKNIKII